MRTSCTITLDLEKVGLWCGWLYGYMWVAYISTSSSAKWIRTREMWELQNRVSTRIIRSDCSSFRPTVSVTSKGRASVHVYNGYSGSIQFGPSVHGPLDSKRRPGRNSSETSTGSRKLSAYLVIKKTFRHEDIQTWRLPDMKIFRHEDIQAWRLSNVMTSIKEGYPSTRRSSTKKIFKLTFTPFCPSLELLSYDITYVI